MVVCANLLWTYWLDRTISRCIDKLLHVLRVKFQPFELWILIFILSCHSYRVVVKIYDSLTEFLMQNIFSSIKRRCFVQILWPKVSGLQCLPASFVWRSTRIHLVIRVCFHGGLKATISMGESVSTFCTVGHSINLNWHLAFNGTRFCGHQFIVFNHRIQSFSLNTFHGLFDMRRIIELCLKIILNFKTFTHFLIVHFCSSLVKT